MIYFFTLILLISIIIAYKIAPPDYNQHSKKGLDKRIDFLLKQFNNKNLNIKKNYILPNIYKNITPKTLECILNSILEHMELKKQVFLVYHRHTEKAYKDKAGDYGDEFLGSKAINIVIHPNYKINDYVSIIAHECSHYFMDEHNFDKNNVLENEKNTDALAVLLGFGAFLKSSNSVQSCYKGSTFKNNSTINHYENYRLGYLSSSEISYIYKKYLKLIKIQHNDFKKQNINNIINSKILELERIHKKNKYTILKIINTEFANKKNNKKDLEKLSKLIYTYQTNIYEFKLKQLKKDIHSSDFTQKTEELNKLFRKNSLFLEKYI